MLIRVAKRLRETVHTSALKVEFTLLACIHHHLPGMESKLIARSYARMHGGAHEMCTQGTGGSAHKLKGKQTHARVPPTKRERRPREPSITLKKQTAWSHLRPPGHRPLHIFGQNTQTVLAIAGSHTCMHGA